MKKFMDENFLLTNETAIRLYHDYAKDMPIFDYHCHLSAQEIAENKSYKNMTEIWLGGDHYKWRLMRSNGVLEASITGNAPDASKFMAFAEALPYAIGNPMYHWAHLELKRYFDIEEQLDMTTAENIWDVCNERLKTDAFTSKALIRRSNVDVICTTDDPIDTLEYHKIIKEDDTFKTKVLPTFRPDKGIHIHLETFLPWLKQLESSVGYGITSLALLFKALEERVVYFHNQGCRLSDHALDEVHYEALKNVTLEEGEIIFKKALRASVLTHDEVVKYKSLVMNQLGKLYAKKGWTMQLHIGALRNNNTRMHEEVGPDTGFDSINDTVFARALSDLLNDLDTTDELPKTIIYVLNPRDNYVIGTMIGNFQGGGIGGKIQFGSGWWFCDQKDGMIDQMKTLAQLGLISRFVGMLTDSRSFLSYVRHEYFRRILCNLFGEWVENGEYPNNPELLGRMIQDICYNNAKNYFGI
ncbi:glucuronate isomerase [Petrocella sp. FN5]|uniref:glucuronate isomerase n=1 Tax=Petrocella sp. FN5 TaxID=3032002 RepID=UPI0023DC4E6B|nr:glucuronate isomerase [Petrocella sp. FN5]MDF1617592.1 glucuronate isomerase [Petrocella sp. FN5]